MKVVFYIVTAFIFLGEVWASENATNNPGGEKIQKGRLSLIKQDTYYKVIGDASTAKCLYHIETDSESLLLIVTPLEISDSGRANDGCLGDRFLKGRFKYVKGADKWMQAGALSELDPTFMLTFIDILPDGNFMFRYGMQPDPNFTWKVVKLSPADLTLVESQASHMMHGRCYEYADETIDPVKKIIDDSRIKAEELCQSIFTTCTYKRKYTYESGDEYCHWVSVYEGSNPKLK